MLWHLFVLPFWIRRHRREFDGFVICAANRRVCAWYPLPTVATIHDLANFHVPGKYSRSRMFYLAHILPFFAKRAQRLVSVSGATKADMVRFWHCRPKDVTVLYDGLPPTAATPAGPCQPTAPPPDGPRQPSTALDSSRRPSTALDGDRPPRGDLAARTEDAALPRSILYISRIEHPGKNHVRLIEAYGRLPRALAEAHPLVLAGADWKDAAVVHEAAARSPHADLIRFTGFADDLEPIWREAGFYVFPSLFEGFGLSLAEAMARGIPCACSGNGSLGEVGGDAAVTFDPTSVDAIACALQTLLDEPSAARAARIARGRARVNLFSWPEHAQGIVRLISDLTQRRRGAETQSRSSSSLCAPEPFSNAKDTKDTKRGDGAFVNFVPFVLNQKGSVPTVPLFGIPVARLTNAETLDLLLAWAREGRARRAEGKHAGPPRVVATVNVDFIVNAVPWRPSTPGGELLECLQVADLVTADGMPIVALSRLRRTPLPERVAGSDLTPALCRACVAEGLRFYVLGGTPEALDEAFAKLGIAGSPSIAGTDSSRVNLGADQTETIDRINAARPDILFVALGNPKQELWIRRNAARLDVPVAIGVGGSFNFVSGRVKRAPRWVQRLGLEWVHRIIQEPGRLWRRYAVGLVKFSWLSILEVCGIRRERSAR